MYSSLNDKDLEGFLFYDEPPSQIRLQEVAKNKLGETEALREECLEQMKTLIKDNDLSCVSRDDFLLRFLRNRKFVVQRSFQMLRSYAEQRILNYDKILNFSPEILKKCIELKLIDLLPYRDSEGRRIIYFKAGRWNPDVCSFEDVEMACFVVLSYLAEEEASQILGIVCLHDTKNSAVTNLAYLIPRLPSISNFLFECLPLRYSAIHIINANSILQVALPLVNPFLPKKIKGRISIHGSNEELHKHINPSILPEEYGGSLDKQNDQHLAQHMLNYLQLIKEEQCYFSQEDHVFSTRL